MSKYTENIENKLLLYKTIIKPIWTLYRYWDINNKYS